MPTTHAMVSADQVSSSILFLRGQRVVLGPDLARMFGVSVRRLNEQVRRNAERFPLDFSFVLTSNEKKRWSQNATTLPNSSIHQRFHWPLLNMGSLWRLTC